METHFKTGHWLSLHLSSTAAAICSIRIGRWIFGMAQRLHRKYLQVNCRKRTKKSWSGKLWLEFRYLIKTPKKSSIAQLCNLPFFSIQSSVKSLWRALNWPYFIKKSCKLCQMNTRTMNFVVNASQYSCRKWSSQTGRVNACVQRTRMQLKTVSPLRCHSFS